MGKKDKKPRGVDQRLFDAHMALIRTAAHVKLEEIAVLADKIKAALASELAISPSGADVRNAHHAFERIREIASETRNSIGENARALDIRLWDDEEEDEEDDEEGDIEYDEEYRKPKKKPKRDDD